MKELKEFGLSENEITTYLTLLKTGTSTANRISSITGMKRSTTYDNLSFLVNKGIVSQITKDNVKYYEAANPKKILHLLDEKRERIERVIPDLVKIKEILSEKTGVTYFEGKKGILTVLNDVLEEGKELWFYGSRKKALISLKHYPDNFLKKRAEKKIRLIAVLAEEDRKDSAYEDKKISALSQLRFLKDLNGIETFTFIYGDRVAFVTSGENPVGIIIKNKETLEQQKRLFNILWKTAKN